MVCLTQCGLAALPQGRDKRLAVMRLCLSPEGRVKPTKPGCARKAVRCLRPPAPATLNAKDHKAAARRTQVGGVHALFGTAGGQWSAGEDVLGLPNPGWQKARRYAWAGCYTSAGRWISPMRRSPERWTTRLKAWWRQWRQAHGKHGLQCRLQHPLAARLAGSVDAFG